MELLTLDDNLQPVKMVENYQSLIWTERYASSGDFTLTSNDVSGMMALLFPDPTKELCLTLRDSSVPMLVEVAKIDKTSGNAALLTVTGRSYETVLERRASVNALPATAPALVAWNILADKPSDAAYKALRIVLGDVARVPVGINTILAPAVSAKDAIPSISLTPPADYSTGVTKTYNIAAGNLYTTVMTMLATNNRGLKAVRPDANGTKVGIEIYNGADLTDTVVFDARFDQFDSATYLLSEQGSTDVAYVYDANGSGQVLKTAGPEPAGLDRRVLFLDQTSDTTDATTRTARGLNELYKYNATALFDGEISVQVAAGFNRDYFLGDILKLNGEYGLSEFVRVAEFIRSSDSSGDKSYPTFIAVDS